MSEVDRSDSRPVADDTPVQPALRESGRRRPEQLHQRRGSATCRAIEDTCSGCRPTSSCPGTCTPTRQCQPAGCGRPTVRSSRRQRSAGSGLCRRFIMVPASDSQRYPFQSIVDFSFGKRFKHCRRMESSRLEIQIFNLSQQRCLGLSSNGGGSEELVPDANGRLSPQLVGLATAHHAETGGRVLAASRFVVSSYRRGSRRAAKHLCHRPPICLCEQGQHRSSCKIQANLERFGFLSEMRSSGKLAVAETVRGVSSHGPVCFRRYLELGADGW